MNRLLPLCALLAFSFIASAADDKAPEEVLKEKGLSKVGITYLLEGDAKLADTMRQFRLAKKTMDDDTRKRIDLENKVKIAKNAYAQWDYEYRQLNEKLGTEKDAFRHNQIIGQINSLVSKMKEAVEYKDAREDDLKKLGQSRDTYINLAIETATQLEELQKQYEALAADADVKAAITKINDKAKPKVKLGPSADFATNLAFVKRERGQINSAIVKINTEGRVPHVDVTINGKVTRSMVLDSGASFVCLTADMAKALDMKPGPKDPTLKLTLADGKVVDAKQMILKSVRVGQFTVENVECAVMPESLIAAENLLGGSFLRNFVYKLDPEAGELHLAQVGGKMNPLDPKNTPAKEAPAKEKDTTKTAPAKNPLDN